MAKKIPNLPNMESFLNKFKNNYSILSERGVSFTIIFEYSEKSDSEFNKLISEHYEKLYNFSSDYYKFFEYNINYSDKFVSYKFKKINSNTKFYSQSKINNLSLFKKNFLSIQAPEKSINFLQRSKNKSSILYRFNFEGAESNTLKSKIAEIANSISTFTPPSYSLSIFDSRLKYNYISVMWSE